jgi:type III pantothenate kinase
LVFQNNSKIFLKPISAFKIAVSLAFMPHLAVDIGNTSIKVGSFENDKLFDQKSFKSIDNLLSESDYITKHDYLIYSSVTNSHIELEKSCPRSTRIIDFKKLDNLPLLIQYKTPESLGSDRMLAALGAVFLYPNQNSLIVDCGTCIKFNMVNNKSEFLGGSISPGLQMRFNSLHKETAKLPLITAENSTLEIIGDSTENSIKSGVINGALAEINAFINYYDKTFQNLSIILTGGDAAFFAKHLKSSIFVEPNLLLNGLNFALNQHLEKIQ